MEVTALDTIDPYITFAEAFTSLQVQNEAAASTHLDSLLSLWQNIILKKLLVPPVGRAAGSCILESQAAGEYDNDESKIWHPLLQ